ncbi:40S ribosomal protein S30 (nucleomorph) [Lotharella oceanica]|uniref:40S ribosomal protein S30 n=1 Tax=Lotharella oceanica TaxID=641309 RepID=A0A060DHP5_9EUKA|nr:40S ribosomal protein S30 [Lotharella oceanica]
MGKIHGSLTRAGKVKNLTKYIPKGPRKKNVKGRKKYRQILSRIHDYLRMLTR